MTTQSTPRTVTLGLPQLRLEADPARNLAHAVEGIRAAAARGAQIVCTPELFLGPYFCQTEDHGFFRWAEPVPGPTTERLGALARGLGGVVVASILERRAEGHGFFRWAEPVPGPTTERLG